MTKDHNGWTITVYALAYGTYKYLCTKPGETTVKGAIDAYDEFEAYDVVVRFVDYITPLKGRL